MALDGAQQHRVRVELQSHFQLVGLTELEAASDLGGTVTRLQRTLQLTPGAEPVDVWQLRDYIVKACSDARVRPRFSVLTATNRLRARLWFQLKPAPSRGSGSPNPRPLDEFL